MSGVRSVICAILICAAYPSAAGILYTKVRILLSGYVLSSPGEAYLYDGTNYPASGSAYRITGHHRIASDSYAIVKDVEFSTTSSYNNTAAASGTPGVCYRGSIDATVVNSLGYTETQGAGTSSFCLPNQGGGSTSPGSGGGSGTVGTGGNTQDCDHTLGGCWSPILINLDSGGYRLTGVDDPVTFDIGANGSPLLLSWTARDASVAFLALDRNHNGRIDDGSELFGNHTPLAGGTPAHEGFEALAQYDANRDSVIDHSDPMWSDLLLWTDRNHDGVSQESELAPLSTSELRSLGCERHFTGRRDEYGNVFRWEARLTQDSRESRPYYDIYFRAAH